MRVLEKSGELRGLRGLRGFMGGEDQLVSCIVLITWIYQILAWV